MTSADLQVREAGRALRVQTEAPHLVMCGSGRLSTSVTLHPIPEGRIIIGCNRDADIALTGTGVEPIHCMIENNNGVVTLHPINGNTSIDGIPVTSPVRLSQGCMLSIGRSNYMRFNHPAEAKQLRSVLPNSRISMAPISFSLSETLESHLERKPPVPPRKSPRNSCSDEEIGFLSKLTKFEMLARQNGNCVSPKVFPAGGLTTNVPADQILGHSRSSSLASLSKHTISPLQNLTNFDRSRSNTPSDCKKLEIIHTSRSNTPNQNYQIPSPNHNHIQIISAAESYLNAYKANLNYNNNENQDLMTRSLICQGSGDLERLSNEFDMSQSLIVAKTTTEYVQVEKFGSNPNLYNRDCNKYLQEFAFNSKKVQPMSPAFNRNPRYECKKNFGRVKSPTPSTGSGCSLEELRERQVDAENKRREAENRRKQAQEERLREQEMEKQEKLRLEEILAMCAEYERQTTIDKPRQPNRIMTNGSLTRDKRSGHNSPFGSPKSTSKIQPHFAFESSKENKSTAYENINVQNSKITFQNGETSNNTQNTSNIVHNENENKFTVRDSQPTTPNNNQTAKWPNIYNNEQSNYFTPSSHFESPSYENIKIENGIHSKEAQIFHERSKSESPSIYGKVNGRKLDSQNYENFAPLNGNLSIYENVVMPRNNIQIMSNTLPRRKSIKSNNSCEIIDNKLLVSDDDLLDAIEQLKMLPKCNDTVQNIPKRINLEKDNAKSNETKSDKENKVHEEEDRKKYMDFLENEKRHILGNMEVFKRSIADIENQEEEINRELELEKALLSAEYESESLKVTQDESEKIKIQMRINELEREMAQDSSSQANLQAEARQRVQNAQHLCNEFEDELSNCINDEIREELTDKLSTQQDIFETERKAFEDLEFHHLEEEASKLATREELQRYLSELSTRIESRKVQLTHLESQKSEIKNSATKDTKNLERQKLGHLRRLEEGRNRLRAIEDELESLARNAPECDEKRSPSREDFDRISRVTTDSPIVNNQGSLGRKTIESLKEIERNRQLHLAKQGSQVISEERRRVEELKRRVQDEVRSQWEERKMNCTSFNSVESGEESSYGPTESGSGSDGAEGATSDKISPSKLSEFTSPSPGPSNNSYSLLSTDNMRDDRRISLENERYSTTSVGILDGNGSRPLSQTSSEMDTLGTSQTIKHREKAKLQRPLTRYLPIKSESLDLRLHIETAGHQLPLIHDVSVDITSCCGYLSKMSKKFHHWNKRWFVFDRKRKTLSYYSDNNAKKPRGVIYFQSIEEVYVDHMNSIKSPQPSLTFIIKTTTRLYHLMAPSSEAMRVWVDVVFTGAEGYHEFDHGV
ncbi:pleckstrin homology-like domain family B member 1 [Leptopilina heterotoma]|uniref:pleckstrin homology-like domain family B member 1 n=1 Tax=Leptopilina heterotoma TaxID=63436 RepID=UPI001CA88EDE|nr:pleckstrin homology-like domain family B member 1 [Leptopilina heterotoma]